MRTHATHPSFAGAAGTFEALARALVAPVSDPSRVAQAHEDVRRLLASENEIRIFIDGTKNLGHQAASLDLLRRVLELTGFGGDVLVLYADYGRADLGATAQKLSFLLPETEGAPLETVTIAHPSGARIRFVSYETRGALPRRARFGFGGGADDMAVNYAAEIGVDWFLRLQPFLWDDVAEHKGEPYYESSRVEAADGRMFYLVDAWPPLRELPLKRPAALAPESITARPRGAEAVAGLIDAGFAIWPIYGLHHFHALAPVVAFNLVSAALLLSVRMARPVALLSFCPLTEDSGLSPILAALARRLSSGPSPTGASDPELTSASMLASTLDTLPRPALLRFARGEGELPPNRNPGDRPAGPEVLLLQLGPVAPALFERILRTAPLPPVIEGQVTANLLLNLGRPYLHLLRPEHVIKNAYVCGVVAPGREALARRMNRVVQRVVQPLESTPPNRPTAAKDLARLVLRLLDSSNAEARYFTAFPRWLAADEHDKVFLGLTALSHAVRAG